jgi:uncharacterized BrkB/YihY/UPF0761 family membrane protein
VAKNPRTTVARRVIRDVIDVYWDSGIADDVPALAWFLLSSLVPLALGLTALATVIVGDSGKAEALGDRIAQVLPKDVHAEIVQLILRTRRDSPLLIAGAIAGMLWTSSGAVGVLARCLSRLLALPRAGVVAGKLRNLAIAAALALLIVLMVLIASAGTGLVRELNLNPVVTRIGVPLVTTAITLLICASVYWALTGRTVSRRAAATGGFVAAVILELTPVAAGYYIRYVAGTTPVEVFLVLLGVLFTCYVAALGLLLGVGVTARVHVGRRLAAAAAR